MSRKETDLEGASTHPTWTGSLVSTYTISRSVTDDWIGNHQYVLRDQRLFKCGNIMIEVMFLKAGIRRIKRVGRIMITSALKYFSNLVNSHN